MRSNSFTYLRLLLLLIVVVVTGSVRQKVMAQTPSYQTYQTPGAGTGDSTGVSFSAVDSLTYSFRGEGEARLYRQATVGYGGNTLSAGEILLSLNRNEVEAFSATPEDTLSYPVLITPEQQVKSSRIAFNYRTEKVLFNGLEMQVQDGSQEAYLLGKRVKNVSRSEVFMEEGRYSTCPPTHMYYYIQADRMKVVDQDEVFFTNARLYILDIPYPIVFPFGYVPLTGFDEKESGLLQPTYVFQDATRRGLGLQNIGWFQYFSDYFTGQTSFDIFTSGSYFNETRMQYRKTGRFSGAVTIGYSKERGLETTDLDFSEVVNKRLSVTHAQEFSPYANFDANINLNTSDYFRRNSYDIDERAQTSASSSVSYRYRHPEQAYNFNIAMRLNQQYATNTTRLSGPESSFSLRQLVPFENRSSSSTQQKWYETITLSYNNNFRSEYSFQPIDGADATVGWFEALFDRGLYEEATGDDSHLKYGFRQQASLSVSRLLKSQYINTGLSFNINDFWYPSTIRKVFNEESGQVETFQERGLTSARDFSVNLNLSTAVYGISSMRIGNFEGFHHTIRPTVGFGYRPDFGDEKWGYYREVQTDTTGRTRQYSIFEEAVFGGPGRGEQNILSFSLSNVLKTKQVRRDSTGEAQSRELKIFDDLSFRTSYNFAADSLNFSDVNVTFSSRIIENLSIQASAQYSLYARDESGFPINRFIWQETNKVLQPLRYSISLSTSQRGGRGYGNVNTPLYQPYDPLDQGFFGPIDTRFNQSPVRGINSSWSFGLNFSYQWQYRHNQPAQKSAILNVNNIQFNLTPKWTFRTRLGYDFIQQELTPSQFELTRRMVCWTLSFQISPFGDFQYYFFRLRIDSSQIQSIFQKLPLLNNLERNNSPTGRSPRF